jgi:hypothetical protein
MRRAPRADVARRGRGVVVGASAHERTLMVRRGAVSQSSVVLVRLLEADLVGMRVGRHGCSLVRRVKLWRVPPGCRSPGLTASTVVASGR